MVMIDMRKPPECAACPMCSYEDDSCVLQPKYYSTWDAQYKHCPLMEWKGDKNNGTEV